MAVTGSAAALSPSLFQTKKVGANDRRHRIGTAYEVMKQGGRTGCVLDATSGFATRDFRSFDITTLEGFKLYRLRQTYDPNFGTLTGGRPETSPRYIQFKIRIFF